MNTNVVPKCLQVINLSQMNEDDSATLLEWQPCTLHRNTGGTHTAWPLECFTVLDEFRWKKSREVAEGSCASLKRLVNRCRSCRGGAFPLLYQILIGQNHD